MTIPIDQFNVFVAEISREVSGLRNDVAEVKSEKNSLINQVAEANINAYTDREKANEGFTDVVKLKDKLKITGESGLGVGGLAATITGIFVTAIPGGAIIGLPLIAGGLASTGTGGVLMGKTICHISTRKDIHKTANNHKLYISYNEAEDLSYGKTVRFINKELVRQEVTVSNKTIYVDGKRLAIF